MRCEIINDLLPLYVDGVCSEETKKEVEEHLKTCPACRKVYHDMARDMIERETPKSIPNEKAIYLRIRQQIGNCLICAILFIAFVGIAFGMMNEIGNHGWPQGIFAIAFIIPSAAFLLSMMNIFFLGEYPSRPWFCWSSAAITFLLCLVGDFIALLHYRFPANWQNLIPYCVIIAIIFAGISLIISKLYSRFCTR